MPEISLEKQVEILHDHYKDSFAHLKERVLLRDRLFLFSVVALVFVSFQISAPSESISSVSRLVSSKVGFDIKLSPAFIRSLVWFALLGLLLRYYQVAVYIERLYGYLNKVEEDICQRFGREVITREGKFYLSQYPFLSSFIHRVYNEFFPLLLVAATTCELWFEYRNPSGSSLASLAVDGLMWAFILIATGARAAPQVTEDLRFLWAELVKPRALPWAKSTLAVTVATEPEQA